MTEGIRDAEDWSVDLDPADPTPMPMPAGNYLAGAVVSLLAGVVTSFVVFGAAMLLALVVATAFGSNIFLPGSEMEPVGLPFVWFVVYVLPAAGYFFVAHLCLRALLRSAGISKARRIWLPTILFVVLQVAVAIWVPILSPFSFLFGGGIAATF